MRMPTVEAVRCPQGEWAGGVLRPPGGGEPSAVDPGAERKAWGRSRLDKTGEDTEVPTRSRRAAGNPKSGQTAGDYGKADDGPGAHGHLLDGGCD